MKALPPTIIRDNHDGSVTFDADIAGDTYVNLRVNDPKGVQIPFVGFARDLPVTLPETSWNHDAVTAEFWGKAKSKWAPASATEDMP